MAIEQLERERIAVGDRVVIYPRGAKGIWTADFWHNGQHLRKSLKTRNKKVATERAVALGAKLATGTIEARRPSVQIAQAAADYVEFLKTRNRARRTLTRYTGELSVFAEFAAKHGVKCLDQISMMFLDRYCAARVEDHSPATLYHETVVIKQLLKWAKKRNLIASNPIADYELSKPRAKEKKAPTAEELRLILRQCTSRRKVELGTLALTGMRAGELQGLKRIRVDLKAGWIDIADQVDGPTKTQGSVRAVPVHPILRALLAIVGDNQHELFFTAEPSIKYLKGGQPINTKKLNEYFKAAAARVGVSGYTVHSLRHFFRTFCINSGIPQDMVDRWMGFSKRAVKDGYYHVHDQESMRFMASVPFDKVFDAEESVEGKDDRAMPRETSDE